eukprot:g5037.t1
MLCAYYFYRKNDQIHRNREAILQFKVHRQEKTVRATEEDVKLLRGAWKIEHTELRLLDRLCVTNRAEVFSAILRGSWTVAVKVLKTRQGGPRTSSTAAAATLGSTSMHNSTGRTAMLGSDASSPHQHPRLSSSSSVSTGSSISSPAMDGDYYGRSGSEAAVQALRSEIEFLMRTRHERLVTFMGFGSTPSGRRFIVMELMETSLDVALWNKPTRNLLERVGILVDVASGLAFLHLRHRALHRDLKSPNVLLARSKAYGQWRAKLADFEASRIVIRGKRRVGTPRLSSLAAVPTATTTTKSSNVVAGVGEPRRTNRTRQHLKSHPPTPSSPLSESPLPSTFARAALWTKKMSARGGTVQWMANELLEDVVTSKRNSSRSRDGSEGVERNARKRASSSKSYQVGPATDIYAYGVLMWEVLAQRKPWAGLDVNTIAKKVTSGERPSKDNVAYLKDDNRECTTFDSIVDDYGDLMNTCWHMRASERPTCDVVLRRMVELRDTCLDVRKRLRSSKNRRQSMFLKAMMPRNFWFTDSKGQTTRDGVGDFAGAAIQREDSPFAYVYSSCLTVNNSSGGILSRKTRTKTMKQLITMGWTHDERLVCVFRDGTVMIFRANGSDTEEPQRFQLPLLIRQ